MKALGQLSRSAPMRRLGKALDRYAKAAVGAVLDVVWPESPACELDAADMVRKVLLVRANFRMGNTLLATALVPVFHARFPGARIDYLAGDTVACLLEGLPIERVHCVSRRFLLAPWRFVALFMRLRREAYDLAVDCGMGSFSGALYTFLSGARQRLGFVGRGNRFLTVRLPQQLISNAYDAAPTFARAVGASPAVWPIYRVASAEDTAAIAMLRELGLGGDRVRPFVAAFVGGHGDKRWATREWLDLLKRVDAEKVPVVVFVGPEELEFVKPLRAHFRESLRIITPQPLRKFASLLAHATLLVTPDSGPMHLAAALGVPVVLLAETERSRHYAPKRPEDLALLRPNSAGVLAALQAHLRWPLLTPQQSRDATTPSAPAAARDV